MNWQLFLSVYLLIFVTELPDKTAFATLLLATQGKPFSVFTGAAAAFLIQTIVAACFGSVFALLPAHWVHIGAGLLFLVFGLQMWRAHDDGDAVEEGLECRIGFWPCAWKAFMVIFIAEWGDLTQIATAGLIAKNPEEKAVVFFAALFALWSVTGVAVVLGQRLKQTVNPAKLKRVCAYLFLAIGSYFIYTALI